MKNKLLIFFNSLLLGLGFVSLLSPAFFYWWIHGDYERYLWIISGPVPYSNFGSGPYQLFVLYISPAVLGIILITTSVLMNKQTTGGR